MQKEFSPARGMVLTIFVVVARRTAGVVLALGVLISIGTVVSPSAWAQTYTVLYSFMDKRGKSPRSGCHHGQDWQPVWHY